MSKFSLPDRIRSFKYAFQGMVTLFRYEHNAWIHLSITMVVLAGGFYFQITKMEWIAVLFAIGIVLAAEAFNTAIEQIANYIQPNQDPRIGKIKDLAAGGVLITAIVAFCVGLLIFLPKIIHLFNN